MFHPQGPTFWELVVEAMSSTERGYDLLAPKFDYTPFRTPDCLLQVTVEHLGAPQSVAAALDIGCGTGAAMSVLRPICRERVVGIDLSQGMIEVGRHNLAHAPGQAAVQFVRGDALNMPFYEEFDLAVCFGTFGHILRRDEPRLVAQIARVLKPGGRFVFTTSRMPPFWSKRYLASRAFNAAMRVRNAVWSPPFIMYYLTFLLPEAQTLLECQGFEVQVRWNVFPKPFREYALVIATRGQPSRDTKQQ